MKRALVADCEFVAVYIMWIEHIKLKVKLKQSGNRPGVAQSVSGGLGSQISMTFGT